PTTFQDTEKNLAINFLKKVKVLDSNTALSPKQASKDQGPLFAGKRASFWLDQLQDASLKFRLEAVGALGNIVQKNKEWIPALVTALRDKDDDVARYASAFLGALGP